MKLLQASRMSFPRLLVAFPELLAPKLLQWRNTSNTFHCSLAGLAQLFVISELPTSRCCRSIMLQNIPPHSLQKWQAWLSERKVPKHSGGFKKRMVPTWTNSLRMILSRKVCVPHAMILRPFSSLQSDFYCDGNACLTASDL